MDGSLAVSFCDENSVNAEPFRKSAEIVELFPTNCGLPDQALPFGETARAMIWAVFGGTSQHRTCLDAARALGVSDDTVQRILDPAGTKKIDAALLFRCLGFYQDKFKCPFDFGGVGVAIVVVPRWPAPPPPSGGPAPALFLPARGQQFPARPGKPRQWAQIVKGLHAEPKQTPHPHVFSRAARKRAATVPAFSPFPQSRASLPGRSRHWRAASALTPPVAYLPTNCQGLRSPELFLRKNNNDGDNHERNCEH